MNRGLSFSTVKKAYVLLNEYFRTMYLEGMINKNPMENVEMIKKANFLSAQGKENLPECETITIFTEEEITKFKTEIEKPKYTQARAYILMLNTGLRAGEMLGVLNSDMDLENKYYTILKNAGIEAKGMHSLRHTFATNLVNGVKQPDGTIKALSPRQVADILGHTTSQITEMYYVKKDTKRLAGITDGFEI